MSETRKTAKRLSLILFTFALIFYVLFQSKGLILGPTIKILEPQDGATLPYGLVEIKGQAKNIAYIYLNDRQIFVDENGNFSEKLLANEGYSIIKLSAKDRFGRTTEKIIRIVVTNSPLSEMDVGNKLISTSTASTTTQ